MLIWDKFWNKLCAGVTALQIWSIRYDAKEYLEKYGHKGDHEAYLKLYQSTMKKPRLRGAFTQEMISDAAWNMLYRKDSYLSFFIGLRRAAKGNLDHEEAFAPSLINSAASKMLDKDDYTGLEGFIELYEAIRENKAHEERYFPDMIESAKALAAVRPALMIKLYKAMKGKREIFTPDSVAKFSEDCIKYGDIDNLRSLIDAVEGDEPLKAVMPNMQDYHLVRIPEDEAMGDPLISIIFRRNAMPGQSSVICVADRVAGRTPADVVESWRIMLASRDWRRNVQGLRETFEGVAAKGGWPADLAQDVSDDIRRHMDEDTARRLTMA